MNIDKKICPHKPRYTYAIHRLNTGIERVGIEALIGPKSIATTQIYTSVGQK